MPRLFGGDSQVNARGEAISTEPDHPTTMRRRLTGGRVEGVDGSMWLYYKAPLAPVVDAKDPQAAYEASLPLTAAVEKIAATIQLRTKWRSMNQTSYRELHLLLVNVPRRFEPPSDHPNKAQLRASYAHVRQYERLLLVGVRLRDKVGGGGGIRDYVDSVVATVAERRTPLSDYDADWRRMRDAMSQAGLIEPADSDFALANAWWTAGHSPTVPALIETDHFHVFPKPEALNAAARLREDGIDCSDWPAMPDSYPISIAAIEDYEQRAMLATDPNASYIPELLQQGAVAISIRALVEPARVTKNELRRNRSRAVRDIREQAENNKLDHGEQEELLDNLSQAERAYATDDPPATLIETSTLVAFTGRDPDRGFDVSGLGRGILLAPMTARQLAAWYEMMLASTVRANPHLHDLPSIRVACSGLPSLSTVGDSSGVLALIGFTERDRQPAWLSSTAASTADGLPLGVVLSQTGGGKTQLLLWIGHQFGEMKVPLVIFDPKIESDHTIPVLLSGGQIASLDDLLSADGVFDPLRFASSAEIGIELAASMLLTINPWGTYAADYETPLTVAIKYGVDRGASCIGQALSIAREAQKEDGTPRFPEHMIDSVLDLAESVPIFRAVVGMNPSTTPLSVSEGITLIKVGRTHLDLPSPNAVDGANLTQRVSLALVRMIVFGSAMAMAGRDGVLLMDEFWTVLAGGATEMDRLGRVARSQRVLPIGFTQKVSDAIDAQLAGYISRGFIGPFEDVEQAVPACELFQLEPTPERLRRLTGKALIGGSAYGQDGAPNWDSFRALRDPATGEFLRGAVFTYADLSGRAVPVEVTIPSWFLRVASTNPKDLDQRTAIFAQVRQEWPDATPTEIAWEVVRRLSPGTDFSTFRPVHQPAGPFETVAMAGAPAE
jgi:hypothetical protein